MESKIIIANHKGYLNYNEVNNYIKVLDNKKLTNDIIICPSDIYLPLFLNKSYALGIQDISLIENKNITGEINIEQISNMHIKYSVIGHNDRRMYFKETNTMINKKIIECLKNDINVILCIGEMEKINDIMNVQKYIENQLRECLVNISSNDLKRIIIAYEPNWSIGNLDAAPNEYISNIVSFIKSNFNQKIKVLYGGSINYSNIKRLVNISNLDGFLIGEASTRCEEFLNIIEVVVNQ